MPAVASLRATQDKNAICLCRATAGVAPNSTDLVLYREMIIQHVKNAQLGTLTQCLATSSARLTVDVR